MKKFILKTGCAVLCLGLLLCLANLLYVNTEYYANLNDMNKFRHVPEHIDIVNFGASHSTLAFDWTDYEQEFAGFNMGLGSQTLCYDAALFDYYFDRLDENSTVVVDVMFKSLYETEPSAPPYDASITRYYQILPKQYIRQWNLKDALQYRIFPILGNRQNAVDNVEGELYERLAGKKEEENTRTPSEQQIMQGNPTQVLDGWEEEEMLAEGKRRAQSFMEQSGAQELGVQYEALIHMIEKCKENNIQIILVTVPTLPCHYEGFTDAFMEKFYMDVQTICEKYDVLYLDYTGDERFLKDYRLYRDTDHFNEAGAKVFTEQFLEDNKDILQFYQGKGTRNE